MPHEQNKRERIIRWNDPAASFAAAQGLTGLEALQAILNGTIPPPPFAMLMGVRLVETTEGRVVFEADPGEEHYNPIGVVHGGLACTLLDSAMGCAVSTMLPAATAYTTLELKVNFVRAMTQDTGRVLCTANVIHVGGRTATAEGRVVDAAGTMYAHATTTCMIFRG